MIVVLAGVGQSEPGASERPGHNETDLHQVDLYVTRTILWQGRVSAAEFGFISASSRGKVQAIFPDFIAATPRRQKHW